MRRRLVPYTFAFLASCALLWSCAHTATRTAHTRAQHAAPRLCLATASKLHSSCVAAAEPDDRLLANGAAVPQPWCCHEPAHALSEPHAPTHGHGHRPPRTLRRASATNHRSTAREQAHLEPRRCLAAVLHAPEAKPSPFCPVACLAHTHSRGHGKPMARELATAVPRTSMLYRTSPRRPATSSARHGRRTHKPARACCRAQAVDHAVRHFIEHLACTLSHNPFEPPV